MLFDYLYELGVDGFMISPAFGYASVCQSDPQGAERIFMTRAGGAREVPRRANAAAAVPADGLADLHGVPLRPAGIGLCRLGQSHLQRSRLARPLLPAWATPTTRPIANWSTRPTGASSGPAGDPRCEHCLVHCGFEPAAVLSAHKGLRDMVRMAMWQMT